MNIIFLGGDATELILFLDAFKISLVTFKQGQKKVGANFSLFVLFFVFQIAYKADYKHDIVDYNYPATLTPSYQTTMKLVPLKDVSPLAMAPPASFLVTFLLWNGSQAARWNETG